MSGGLIQLVSYGNENVVLNGNPQITWFNKAFVRYTHFSQEPVEFPLEGPQQLLLDSPILLKARIPRVGDLLSDLVLRVDVPDIFSKAYVTTDTSGNPVLSRTPHEFAWVRQLGARMIERVTFTVGGTKVQEFTGDWIAARALLDQTQSEYQKWRVMVGDVPELFDPANGIYRDPVAGGYPNVVAWQTQQQQQNAPSIPGRSLRLPLGLWFSDFIGNSLPLVALQNHIPEVQIQLRPMRDLYTVMDPSGVRLRYGTRSLPYIPSDQYNTVWNPALLGPLPQTLNNLYGSYSDLSGAPRHFFTDFGTAVPSSDGWNLNPRLEGTFTFVTDAERQVFAERTVECLVRQVQVFPFTGVVGRTLEELDVHNIASRIAWFARRSDAIPYRNDYTNLTNWIYTTNRPYVTPLAGYPAIHGLGRSGLIIPGIQRRILRGGTFIASGTNIFDGKDSAYFSEYVPYRYLRGNTAPAENFGLAAQNEMWPIHVFSFALNASDPAQPSGTLNTSRINKLQIDFDVEPIPVGANYTYNVYVYVETLNFLVLSNGMGGLKFAL
jgi:hypothetical protein